jgi:hypothetical protein
MSNSFDDDDVDLMESVSKPAPKEGFISHMTRFDDTIKGELMNIVQYTSLGIVPVLLLNKLVNTIFPELDEDKASWELGSEILGQLLVMFVGVFYINRIITYVSPYSGRDYPTISVLFTILPVLMLLLSIQSKISSKSNVLYHRFMVILGQEPEDAAPITKQPEDYFRVSQPIAGHPSIHEPERHHPPMREGLSSMGPLPPQQQVSQTVSQPQQYAQPAPPQQSPPQQAPPQNFMSELQPANEIGGNFGSAF